MEMRYFQSVKGKAFLRPGRPGIYLGCKRKPRDKETGVSPGFVWDTDAVIAVSIGECNENLRDWNDAVRDDVLIEVEKKNFEAANEALEASQKKAAEAKAKAAEAKAKADKKAAAKTTNEEG